MPDDTPDVIVNGDVVCNTNFFRFIDPPLIVIGVVVAVNDVVTLNVPDIDWNVVLDNVAVPNVNVAPDSTVESVMNVSISAVAPDDSLNGDVVLHSTFAASNFPAFIVIGVVVAVIDVVTVTVPAVILNVVPVIVAVPMVYIPADSTAESV